MKIILFLLIFIIAIFTDNIKAQPSFDNDTSYTSIFQSLIQQIDSNFILEKKVDFELRLWTQISKTAERRLFILTLKENKWSARFFQRIIFQKDTLIEVHVSQKNLETLWRQLKKNRILILPDQSDLRDRNGKEILDPIYDGHSYRFELLTREKKRTYSYTCPKNFYENYKYIEEYKRVVNLVKLIYKHLRIEYNVC